MRMVFAQIQYVNLLQYAPYMATTRCLAPRCALLAHSTFRAYLGMKILCRNTKIAGGHTQIPAVAAALPP